MVSFSRIDNERLVGVTFGMNMLFIPWIEMEFYATIGHWKSFLLVLQVKATPLYPSPWFSNHESWLVLGIDFWVKPSTIGLSMSN